MTRQCTSFVISARYLSGHLFCITSFLHHIRSAASSTVWRGSMESSFGGRVAQGASNALGLRLNADQTDRPQYDQNNGSHVSGSITWMSDSSNTVCPFCLGACDSSNTIYCLCGQQTSNFTEGHFSEWDCCGQRGIWDSILPSRLVSILAKLARCSHSQFEWRTGLLQQWYDFNLDIAWGLKLKVWQHCRFTGWRKSVYLHSRKVWHLSRRTLQIIWIWLPASDWSNIGCHKSENSSRRMKKP